MRELGTVPNGVTCSALMDACLKADELDLAFAVLEHMLDVGIEPTQVRRIRDGGGWRAIFSLNMSKFTKLQSYQNTGQDQNKGHA